MAPSPGLPRPWPRPRSPGGAGRRRRREGQSGSERWGRAVGWPEKGGRGAEGRERDRGMGDGQRDEEKRG